MKTLNSKLLWYIPVLVHYAVQCHSNLSRQLWGFSYTKIRKKDFESIKPPYIVIRQISFFKLCIRSRNKCNGTHSSNLYMQRRTCSWIYSQRCTCCNTTGGFSHKLTPISIRDAIPFPQAPSSSLGYQRNFLKHVRVH